MWYERTGDQWFKEEAYRYFNHATYMVELDGVVQVGHNWGGEIWFSDGYTDYIRHFMEGIAAIPEWAPAVENHLLRSSSVIKKIQYGAKQISFTTFDNLSKEVLRLNKKPLAVLVNNKLMKYMKNDLADGYTWLALQNGGVLKLNHINGNEVKVIL